MTTTIALRDGRLSRDEKGNLAFFTGIDACMQNCQTAMQTVQGEMMYNVAGGMPYQVTVWDNYRPQLFESAARLVLLNVKDVLSVESIEQSVVDGILSYTATIRTVYGLWSIDTTGENKNILDSVTFDGESVLLNTEKVKF